MSLSSLSQYAHDATLFLRLVLGVIFIYHGLPKIRNPEAMAQGLAVPNAVVVILGLAETLAALGVIFAIYIHLSALIMAIVMLGAIFMKITKWKSPFSAYDKTGWEFDLILLAASAALLFSALR
jgi:uncharacterized membrane protein YphA (DoxX/SURF4 family)